MEDKIKELIEEPINKMGIKIDSISYTKEGKNYFLRIFIDREEIIDVDTCVEVTNLINPILDKCDLLNDSYILDVSTKEKGDIDE